MKARARYLVLAIGALMAVSGTSVVAPAPAQAASNAVVPINWSSFSGGNPTDADSLRVKTWMNNATKYALTTWWTAEGYAAQSGTYLDLGGTAEVNVRPPGMEAFTLAISIQTGAYDSALTGVSLADAKLIALKLIRSVAYRHRANTAGGWGNVWQSPLWAYFDAYAGWLIWSDLSVTDREYVRKMMEYEANLYNTTAVPYYKNRAGTVIFPGDTKAEENGWVADALGLAASMMPNHANYSTWMNKAIEYTIGATARPADIGSSESLHGKTVDQWINGSNINDDGTLVNHGFINPHYIAIAHITTAPIIYRLAGKPTPNATLFNLDYLYNALVDANFTSPPWDAPGGTMYIDGTYSIYFPDGNDQGTDAYRGFAMIDVAARAFGFDNLASQSASYWEDFHVQKNVDQQSRFTDRHTYLNSTESTSIISEEHAASRAAWSYMIKWIKNQGAIPYTNASFATSQVTLGVVNDSYVQSGTFADTNYGYDPALLVRKTDDPNYQRESYLKFDMSSASSISNGKLRLFGSSGSSETGVTAAIYSSTNTSWTGSGITWNNKPATGSAVHATITLSTAAGWNEWDITSFLQAEKAAGRNLITLVVKDTVLHSYPASFSSVQGSSPPQLVITQ